VDRSVKIAGALACAAFVLCPAVGTAEINPSIRVPPGWVKIAATHSGSRAWRRNRELLEVDIQNNGERLPLVSFINHVVLPDSNSHGAHVIRSAATTTCAGRRRAWRVVLSLPVRPAVHAVVDAIITVSGNHAYVASYARLPTSPPSPDAERAIRSLCLKRI